jgi:hypothetical protein
MGITTRDTIRITCSNCKQNSIKVLSFKLLRVKYQGQLVQNEFPELSADERELIISGICGKCFDDLLGPEY